MSKMNKTIFAAMLGFAILLSSSTSASAQSFGRVSSKEKVAAIGGGAAAGAVIGGLLGGKKGAIIGGLLGAAGGTGYVYYKGRNDDRYYRGRDFRDNRRYDYNSRFDSHWRSDRRLRDWDHSRHGFRR